MKTWKRIKEVVKEEQLKKELPIKEQRRIDLLKQELKSIIETTSKTTQSKTKIKSDIRIFGNFLATNFKSNKEFTEFLNILCLEKELDQEVITFKNEYKKALPIEMKYDKYINWNNYTTYSKTVLIISAFQTYYSNLPQRQQLTFIHKGLIGKADKSKRRKLADKGTSEEYVHKIKTMVNPVLRWLYFNGQKFKNNIVTKFIRQPDGRYLPVNTKGNNKEVVQQYKWIHPYAFKLMGLHQLSAFKGKREVQRLIKSRAKRVEEITEKGNDIMAMRDYLSKTFNYQMFDCKADDTEINKRITIANKLFRLKSLQGNITNTKGELFKNKFVVALQTWDKGSL